MSLDLLSETELAAHVLQLQRQKETILEELERTIGLLEARRKAGEVPLA